MNEAKVRPYLLPSLLVVVFLLTHLVPRTHNPCQSQLLLPLRWVAQDGTKGLIASPSSIVARSIAADDDWNTNLLKLKTMTSRMEMLYKGMMQENPAEQTQ